MRAASSYNGQMPAIVPVRPGTIAGFTLIEMLVVLTIMGIVAALALPNLSHRPAFVTRGQLHAQLEQAFSGARQRAMAGGVPVVVDLKQVAPKAALRFVPTLGDPRLSPVFEPDGSSNGGTISTGGVTIATLAWMTGRIVDAAR